ncbi:MAG: NADH-quinone oxidoreductase subunit NuoN [Betaproteobacteria bacterium]|nr:NADH-quinone oxidoreductase subunit NuoN [Betaproteobacteria bacterium]
MVNTTLPDFLPALPEVFLLIMACAVLIMDLFVKSERRAPSYLLAQFTLVGCASLTLMVMIGTQGVPLYTFSGLFVADMMSHVLKLCAYIAVSTALVYSRQYLLDRGLMKGEFLALLLFALLGMMVLISANSFLTIYMGLELLSLCLYAMVALNRDSAASTEAAMKYFVLGALASGLLLYGMSMIYGATGTLTITEVAKSIGSGTADKTILVFGLVFTVSGLAFKLGVAPFHMWIPDVYHGAPTAVTLVIGTGPKLAAFAMAMRLLVNGMLDLAADWQQMLVIMAVLSMAIGNVTAIAQTNLKRMLAYSTISHMGFLLVGLLSGVVGGNWFNAADAYSAAMFYVIVYVLMSLGAFGMLLFLSRAGFECEHLDDLKGLSRRSPWYAFIMLVLMFSLAGIPPTAGFFAKYAVLSAAVAAGQVWLAVVAVVFSLIGAFYYLRIVKLMYFDAPDAASSSSGPVEGPGEMRILLSINGLALLALGILPQPLLALCMFAIKSL